MGYYELLSRCWSDGGAPPEGAGVSVMLKNKGISFNKRSRIPASPLELERYFEDKAGFDVYYSPVVKLETGEKITSSIVIDNDERPFGARDIIPFATVYTGRGHEQNYIALDKIYTVEEIKPIAAALNRYCGGDGNFVGEYIRRWFDGFNYKTEPPQIIFTETSPRLVKYSLDKLANKAGMLFSEPIPALPIPAAPIIEPASREAFGKLENAALKDFALAQIYFEGEKRKSYKSTSEASFALARALLFRGFTRGEVVKILLNWPKGIAFSPNNLDKTGLLARASRIIDKAEYANRQTGLASPEISAIWLASSRNRGRGISEMKLWKNSGLSREAFTAGLDALNKAGLAEIRREERTGKNSRRIIFIANIQDNLFAGNYWK